METATEQLQQTGRLPRLTDRERRRAAPAPARPAPGRYLVVEGPDEDVLVPLEGDVTHLGRGVGCDIRLDDPSVSRRHALIVDRGEQIVLLDDRSMNGTWLNGERVLQAPLADGDVVQLGAVRLRYVDVPAR